MNNLSKGGSGFKGPDFKFSEEVAFFDPNACVAKSVDPPTHTASHHSGKIKIVDVRGRKTPARTPQLKG
jgi:hypothetical protein